MKQATQTQPKDFLCGCLEDKPCYEHGEKNMDQVDEEKDTQADRAVVVSWKTPLPVRFSRSVEKTDTCWLWTGRTIRDGYGSIRNKGKRLLAHRVSWEIHHGEIPNGLFVLHKCDNPPRVNPDHLFLGTKRDNNIDMSIKERATIKLTNAQVREARTLHASGAMGYRKLAKHFGVSPGGIKDIIKKVRRAYV